MSGENVTVDINDRTKVGLFAVLGAMPFVISGIIWASFVYFKAEAAMTKNIEQDTRIEKHDVRFDAQWEVLIEIRDRLTRLEESRNKGR